MDGKNYISFIFIKFQSAIETLIRICRHPPRPDAVCRYLDCPMKSQIYLTDPGRCYSFTVCRRRMIISAI